MKTLVTVAIVGVALWSIPPAVLADDVGNAFTYQGELRQGGSPATGTFVIEFSLWDDSITPPGVQISLTESKKVTPDPDGRFTVTLDFGVAPYMTNEALWLQIVVNGSPLSPRQRLTPAPFSLATRGLNVTSTGRLQIGNNSIIGISNAGTSLGNLELSQTVNLNNFNAGNISLRTSETAGGAIDRLTIRPNGNVGIGTASPAAKLTINQGTAGLWTDGIRLVDASANFWDIRSSGGFLLFGLNESAKVTFKSDGNVGIGTTNPGFKLEVNGSAGKPGGGSWSNSSDRRLKNNIRNMDGALDKLEALRGVTFEYKDPEAINELPGERIGMIAQEVEDVFPDWVDVNGRGHKTVTYRGFEALTVEALRELRQEKDAEIAALRAEMDERIAALEKKLVELTVNEEDRLNDSLTESIRLPFVAVTIPPAPPVLSLGLSERRITATTGDPHSELAIVLRADCVFRKIETIVDRVSHEKITEQTRRDTLLSELEMSACTRISVNSYVWLVGWCHTGGSYAKETPNIEALCRELFGYVPDQLVENIDLKKYRYRKVPTGVAHRVIAYHGTMLARQGETQSDGPSTTP